MNGPGLLAHVLTAKLCDNLLLYRQIDDLCPRRSDLDRSILAKWVVESSSLLKPLIEVLLRYLTSATSGIYSRTSPNTQFRPPPATRKRTRSLKQALEQLRAKDHISDLQPKVAQFIETAKSPSAS